MARDLETSATNTTQHQLSQRLLFGSAISILAPLSFMDVSAFRQVPDNQEVMVDSASDDCVIVELLESSEISGLATGINRVELKTREHFDQLAIDCKSTSTRILSTSGNFSTILSPDRAFVTGEMRIAKFNEGETKQNIVRVYVGVVWLEKYETDVVVVFNQLVAASAESSSAEMRSMGNDNSDGMQSKQTLIDHETFSKILASFILLDPALFA